MTTRHVGRVLGHEKRQASQQPRATISWTPDAIAIAKRILRVEEQYVGTPGLGVETWTDKWTGHNLQIAGLPNRPLITAADADFNGKPSFLGDGVDDVLQDVAGISAELKPAHDGTGFVMATTILYTALTGTAVWWSSQSSIGIPIGASMRVDCANQSLLLSVGNGTGLVISVQTQDGEFTRGVPHRVVWMFKAAASGNEYELWIDEVIWAAGRLGTTFLPSGASPSAILTVFRNVSATEHFAGKAAALMMHGEADRSVETRAYMRDTYKNP